MTLTYSELLYPDGSVNPMTSVTGQIKGEKPTVPGAPAVVRQQDIFILAGNSGKETFQPLFTYRGFRYIEIAGYNGTLATTDITGLRMQSDIQPAGSFECSDPLINRIQEATLNSFRSNIFSVQSDCPHREKFGYGADMLTTAEAYIYNFDMYAFYAKALQDYEDAARLEGGLTETAPFVGIADAGLGDGSGPIGWGTFLPAGMDKHYRYYGNKEMIRQHYPTTKRWVEFLKSKAVNNIIDVGLSDHESIAEKPVRLTSTLFYYYRKACTVNQYTFLLL
ncbi:MAG: family 78 glycoside hydrolase catalytic domain [Tannerellaceae bacterium]|nr:family 78 glycoside hydrolase catalytic domain [Tannerellaceae bacterium]